MIQFRPPSMRETTPTGQINELRRYLFQLVEQLNYMAGLEQNKAEAVKIEAPADIPGGGGGSGEIPEASEIPYDNAVSGIEADNVQDAIDTIDQMLDGKVDIVSGKGLSTNDYTDGEAQKVLEALTYTAQSLTEAQKQQARDNIGAGTGGGGHTYSTTEQVVGTWIDGKPVYERVFIINGYFQSGEFNVSHDAAIDTPISHTAYGHISSAGYVGSPRVQPVNSGGNSYVNADITFELMNIATDSFKFFVGNTWATNTTYRFDKIIVICRYTKTTD